MTLIIPYQNFQKLNLAPMQYKKLSTLLEIPYWKNWTTKYNKAQGQKLTKLVNKKLRLPYGNEVKGYKKTPL